MSSQSRNKKINSCFQEKKEYDDIPSCKDVIYNCNSIKVIHLYSFIKKHIKKCKRGFICDDEYVKNIDSNEIIYLEDYLDNPVKLKEIIKNFEQVLEICDDELNETNERKI